MIAYTVTVTLLRRENFLHSFFVFCLVLIAKASNLTHQIAARVIANFFTNEFQNSAKYLGNSEIV